jgi:phage FluMu gp28-like protein
MRKRKSKAAKAATPTPVVGSAKPEIFVPSSPRDLMLSYQKRWADDDSRFKIGLQARQTGKDYGSGEEGVRDCYQHEIAGRKTDWMIAAPSERQSLESLEKWKEWTEAYQLSIADIIEERESKGSEALLKACTIVFPNGSRVMAVPGKPDTVRGFSSNVLMTEFAFFEDPDATWRAILPSITNPLRGKKKMRIISTANGQGNKFHSLWAKNYGRKPEELEKESAALIPAHVRERILEAIAQSAVVTQKAEGLTVSEAQMIWSCHLVTIYDAVREGLPVNLFELYAGMDDPEGWAQEFECEFLDAAAVLLPYELIALCE